MMDVLSEEIVDRYLEEEGSLSLEECSLVVAEFERASMRAYHKMVFGEGEVSAEKMNQFLQEKAGQDLPDELRRTLTRAVHFWCHRETWNLYFLGNGNWDRCSLTVDTIGALGRTRSYVKRSERPRKTIFSKKVFPLLAVG